MASGRRKTRRSGSGAAARNRLLPAGRVSGPMPWIIAIMMFLTVMAAASGLGLQRGMQSLGADLADGATVQIVEANAELRRAAVRKIEASLHGMQNVRRAQVVDDRTLAEQLRPWLGEEMEAADLPIPSLIDVEFATDAPDNADRLQQAVGALVPSARVEAHSRFLQPLEGLVHVLTALAGLLVALMALATAAVVVLAARSAHESHRTTIDILHLMGATDVQIARLFQRRIALDALFGGMLGFLVATGVLLLIGQRLDATQSDLMRAASLSPWGWAVLVALPLAGVALATLTARYTVLRALRLTL